MIRGDAPRNARLVVVAAGPEVNILREEFPLDAQATIGRDTTNDISFPDDFISVRHALVTWSDNRWWIEDQGSTNGTTVNDRPIKSRVPIGPNDVIGVGRVRLRLSTD